MWDAAAGSKARLLRDNERVVFPGRHLWYLNNYIFHKYPIVPFSQSQRPPISNHHFSTIVNEISFSRTSPPLCLITLVWDASHLMTFCHLTRLGLVLEYP